MSVCRLCITEIPNKNGKFIFNENLNIAKMIGKYLWFEPKVEDFLPQIICNCCWEDLSSFDKFYSKVTEAQSVLLMNKKEDSNSIDLNIKTENFDASSNDSINVLPNPTIDGDGSECEDRESNCSTNKIIDCLNIEAEIEQTSSNVKRKNTIKSSSTKTSVTKNNVAKNNEKNYSKSRFDEIDKKISDFMKLFCDICMLEFPKFSEIKTHFRIEHNMTGYVVCCDKKYNKRIYLSDHIDCHLNPEEFKCNICNRVQKNHNALRQHIKVIHEKPKNFKCETCSKLLASKFALELHKYTHIPENERKFKCPNCDKCFASEIQLNSHYAKVHESLSSNVCHICGKTIKDNALFKRHQLEHEGIVEPRAQCKICDIWLKNEMSLRKHLRNLHDDSSMEHICPMCKKKCPTRSALKSHKFYVHSNRTYECTICKKEFKKAISLREHMTTHTGEILYTCPHCPKTFTSNANLHHHRKKDHRLEWEQKRANSVLKRSINQ